ncbi:hypothetical protein MesoLj113c_40590 [Mesorhizobium sp. 113-3-9]|nr:hypothetical protein MesoLj113c_40590 [Mesorhizobium sp. 113-3-9]
MLVGLVLTYGVLLAPQADIVRNLWTGCRRHADQSNDNTQAYREGHSDRGDAGCRRVLVAFQSLAEIVEGCFHSPKLTDVRQTRR